MSKRILGMFNALLLALSGCATAGKSTLLGAGIGSGVGASVGILANQGGSSAQRAQGALIGAGIGGILGALLGHESYSEKMKKEEARNFDANAARLEIYGSAGDKDKRPQLRPAQVKVRYVEDQIKDGTFVPAHLEYEISEPARWEKSK